MVLWWERGSTGGGGWGGWGESGVVEEATRKILARKKIFRIKYMYMLSKFAHKPNVRGLESEENP